MKKRTSYHRKRMMQPQRYMRDGMEWLYAIQRSQPFSDEVVPGAIESTQKLADQSRNQINAHYGALVRGAWGADETTPYDALAHAVDVTAIRCFQIGGENNPYRAKTRAASEALQSCRARWERSGKWGATRPEQIAIWDALEVFEAVLQASSPAQMQEATDIRMSRVLETLKLEHV